MTVSREEKKIEALARMEKWGIFPETIGQFKDDNLVSESAPPFGACFWLSDAQLERVREFEEKNSALVYHVIHSFTNIGELESYMYVSDYPEEWEQDRDDIAHGRQLAYVQNLDAMYCSEFGSIGVELSPAAGLTRTW